MMLKMYHNTANLGLGWWLPCPDLRHRVCMPISRFLSWEVGSKGGQEVGKGGGGCRPGSGDWRAQN